MTPIKQNTFIKKVKDITISGSLSMLILSAGLYSCSSGSDSNDYEQTEEVYTQGTRTYIKEVAKGEFKITEEIAVPADSSKAIVTYLDGREEVLTKEASQKLIDDEIANNESHIGHNNGLSNVLLYSGIGYFLGRTMRPNYGYYRPDFRRDDRQSTSSTGMVPRGGVRDQGEMSKFYSNNESFAKSNEVKSTVSRSRTSVSRPSGSRSGFFGSGSRSGFGG